MKALLEENRQNHNKQKLYQKYWPMIPEIEKFIPESKREDVAKIKKILKEYEKAKEPAKMEGGEEYMMFN